MTLTHDEPALAVQRAGHRKAWILTGVLVVFLFLNYADKAVLAFAGDQIQDDLQITAAQFGLVQSAFYWLFAVGALTIGLLTTRVGIRVLLAVLMLVWVTTMFPLLGTTSFPVLLISRLVLGFAEGPAYALATHAVHGWFPPEKRALPAGLITAGSSIGPLLCAPGLAWIIVNYRWHAAFGVLVVAGLLWALAWFVLARDVPADHCLAEQEAEPSAEISYWALIRTGTVAGFALLLFLGYWSTSLKLAWLPVYLSDGLGYGTLTTGRLVMLPYGAAAIGAISAGYLSNRLIARGVSLKIARGYLAGGLVATAGLAMYGLTLFEPGPMQMVMVTIAFSGNVASYAVALAGVADVVPAKKRGPLLAGVIAFATTAGIIAPLIMGFSVSGAADAASGYGFGFAFTGILMAAGSVVATLFVDPARDAARIKAQMQERT